MKLSLHYVLGSVFVLLLGLSIELITIDPEILIIATFIIIFFTLVNTTSNAIKRLLTVQKNMIALNTQVIYENVLTSLLEKKKQRRKLYY